MKLSKDKASLIYNQFLTLSGIPKETYEYRLGNRSALEWVVDQYQVSTEATPTPHARTRLAWTGTVAGARHSLNLERQCERFRPDTSIPTL